MYTNKKQNGFTLVEMILYIALLSVGLVSVLGFADRLSSARVKTRSIVETQQEARFAMHHFSYTVHGADNIDEALTVLDSDEGVLAVEIDGENVVYALDDGLIIRTDSTGSTPLTSSAVSVSSFRIEDRTAGSGSDVTDIVLTLTVDHRNPGDVAEFRSSTTLTLPLSLRL